MVTCKQEGEDKRRTEVEDEPRGEKIGLLLTEHKASGLGPLSEDCCHFRSRTVVAGERAGDIACRPSAAAT